MRSMLLKIFISGLWICLMPVVTRAQSTLTVDGFTTDRQSQVIQYVASRAALVPVIKEAVTTAVDRYNRLFSTHAPPIFIDVVAEAGHIGEDAVTTRETLLVPAPTGSLGTAARREVCYMVVNKNSRVEYPDDEWRFIIAHEVSHCYQYYHLVDVPDSYVEESKWWLEGTADWMATLVYPASMGGTYWADHQDLFVRRMGGELLIFSYDASYFWQFLTTRLGEFGVMDFLRGIPANPAQHESYLSRQFPDLDGLFHDLGMAVGNRTLSYLPDDASLWGQLVQHITLPGDLTFTPQKMSFSLYQLDISGLAPGRGVILTASDISESHTRVSLSDGTEIPELTPVTVCDNTSQLRVIVSRGQGGTSAEGTLHVASAPCPTPTPPAPPSGNIPACMVGTWHVTGLPDFPGVVMTITGGDEIVDIAADGMVQVTVNDFQLTSNNPRVVTTIQNTTGSYQIVAVTPDGQVTADHVEAQMGTALVEVSGQTIHMDLSSASGSVTPVAIVASKITCASDGTLKYVFTTQGHDYEYTLSH